MSKENSKLKVGHNYFIIRRSKWARGVMQGDKRTTSGENDNALLVGENNTMCCLGFACRAIGVPAKKLLDVGLPSTMQPGSLNGTRRGPLREALADEKFCKRVASLNDCTNGSKTRNRERDIKNRFKKVGVHVDIID